MFVDHGRFYIHPTDRTEGGMVRQFIPAKAEDNPSLLENDPDYLARLEGLGDPALVRAMREGDWSVVAGSMFGDKWREHRHVIRPFAIPGTWEIWRGGDDGYASPASIHWITQNPDTGTYYVIGEIYKAGLLPEELARFIVQRDKTIKLDWGDGMIEPNEEPLDGEMDTASFSDIGSGNPSRGNQMNKYGTNWRPVEKPAHSRVMRVHMMHMVLSPNPKEKGDRDGIPLPGMRFFNHCQHAIRTIPTLPVSDRDPEDVNTDAEDHAFDSITYALTRHKVVFARGRVFGI
jgi:hypothetical protein